MRYPIKIKEKVRKLRSQGKTYSEINKVMGINFAKATLYDFCKSVILPSTYGAKIKKMNQNSIKLAWKVNKLRRKEFLNRLDSENELISKQIYQKDVAKIALAMLCLGEASKYGTGSVFSLGSSNPKIIVIFLALLKQCFNFNFEKVRCTVQCRADQNTFELEKYWQKTSGIPKRLFYKTRIDPRTIGRPTRKTEYKGVLKIDYINTEVQLELESLAKTIYNKLLVLGPVVHW